jgi:hypothetical protein
MPARIRQSAIRAWTDPPPRRPSIVTRMTESPIVTLMRWEEHGAVWRTRHLSETAAIVELCSCAGEPVDELRSEDPELLCYLAGRPRSDADSA